MNARLWFASCLIVAIVVPIGVVRSAELAPAQRDKLVWIDQQLQKIVTLYRDRKTDDMQKLVGEIETAINEVRASADGDESIEPALNPFRARLAAAQKLASHVPATVAAAAARPVMPKKPTPGDPGTGGVSFTKQIAPIFIAKCNNCHVTGNRGDFSMASYQALMLGTAGQYAVVKPGKGDTSTLVEKLASGEMPPGGNKCTDEEINLLIKWIDEGAKFDGPDMTASLGSLAPAMPNAPGGPPAVVRATGNEKVHFMRDVAPILLNNCMECHGAAQANDNASNYSMRSFNQLIRGGQNSRSVITPGDPEGSFIVKMLRGTAKAQDGTTNLRRMPSRRDPLDDADMNTLLTWITEGAKFDGDDPAESIQLLWDIEQAKKATHEELTASRMNRAKQTWPRANPDSPYELIEAGDFTVLGNLGNVRMQEFVKQAQDEREKLISALKLPTGAPLVKGRITIMLFDKKFEYAEFGRVAEGRQLPTSQLAHWRFNFIDCYAAVVAQPTAEETAPLLSEVIAGAYLDSLGSVAPRWFAVGTARNIASKIHGKTPLVKAWEDAFAPARTVGLTPNSILTTTNLDANAAAISQAFVKDLMKSPAWATLMSSIAKGTRFEPAFQQAFRTQPAPLMTQWLGR